MRKPTTPRHQLIWATLLLSLVALGVFRAVAQGGRLEAWLGEDLLQGGRLILGLISALAVLWIALREVGLEAERADPTLDRIFLLLVLSWVFSSAVALIQDTLPADDGTTAVRHMAYQLSAAATLGFLRRTALVSSKEARPIIVAQLVIGMGVIVWRYLLPGETPWALEAWRITNMVGFSLVFLVICRAQLIKAQHPRWLCLGACLMGFGMGMNDMALADGQTLTITVMHTVFSAYLLLLWLMLTQRVSHLANPEGGPDPALERRIVGGEFAESYLYEAPMHGAHEVPGGLVQAKRRFAQELHDGVGSQLVNILASLDRAVPQQRDMALAVEQCLLDVKILVDDIDGGDECVFDALARLRFRVQASLERLGITLDWDIRHHPALEKLRDERSRQVLRIVQEALANVMRHSGAKRVRVSCSYKVEGSAMLVEVADDGLGFDAEREARRLGGKGLLGMRRRSDAMGATLEVLSDPGEGARVCLLLPLGKPVLS